MKGRSLVLKIWIFVCQQLEDSDDTIWGRMIINGRHIAYGKIDNTASFMVIGQGQGHAYHNLKNKFVVFSWFGKK